MCAASPAKKTRPSCIRSTMRQLIRKSDSHNGSPTIVASMCGARTDISSRILLDGDSLFQPLGLAGGLDKQPPCGGSRQWQCCEAPFGMKPYMIRGMCECTFHDYIGHEEDASG